MVLWRSGALRPCHVPRCGRHSGYRAGKTQNPREVQKCRKRRLNVKCCLLTLQAAQCDDTASFFVSFCLLFFPSFRFCILVSCKHKTALWVELFYHLILYGWHICMDLTNSGLVILRNRPQPPLLCLLLLAFSPSCTSTPRCFALFLCPRAALCPCDVRE